MSSKNQPRTSPQAPKTDSLAVRRAILPEIMCPDDVRVALGLASTDEAEAAMRSGSLGPCAIRAGRVYLLRTTFLAHLEGCSHSAPLNPPPYSGNGGPQ